MAVAREFDEMTVIVVVTVFVTVTVTVNLAADVRTGDGIRGRDGVLLVTHSQRPTTASPMMSQYEMVLPQFTAKLDLADDTVWYSA